MYEIQLGIIRAVQFRQKVHIFERIFEDPFQTRHFRNAQLGEMGQHRKMRDFASNLDDWIPVQNQNIQVHCV